MKRLALLIVSCIALISPGIATAQTPTADTAVQISETPELGQFLTDAKGMTLYIFKKDEVGSGKSVCNDDCALNWPPFHAADTSALPEGFEGELTTITRDDGTEQTAYNGSPLYFFAADKAPGDTTGQEVGDVWYVASVGAAATPEASPVAGGTVVLISETPELGQFLTDAKGMTLYIFKKDEVGSGKSVCNDDCALNWPPFSAEDTTALPDGFEGELTTITRDDGTAQLAYNGAPLYYFAADKAPGDTTGQAVGDVWYVASVGDGSAATPAA